MANQQRKKITLKEIFAKHNIQYPAIPERYELEVPTEKQETPQIEATHQKNKAHNPHVLITQQAKRQLKLISANTGETMLDVLTRLIAQEWENIQK